MTLEEIVELWKVDSIIDTTNLIGATTDIPKLHNKYYQMYVKEGLRTKRLRTQLSELEKAKTEYYNGTMDIAELKQRGWSQNPLKILRQDMIKYLESDKDIIELSLTIDYHHSLEKFLEDIIKQINNRNFLIRSIIDWSKFTSGTG